MPTEKNTLQLPESELLPECVRMLREGKTVMLTARGSSMYPFIHDRDKVCLSREGGFREGDIVLAFTDEGRHVMHRIISINGDMVRLMGDANLKKTESCSVKDIAGKAVSIMRDKKTILCSSAAEKTKAKFWRMLLPVRRAALKMLRTRDAVRLRIHAYNQE